MIEQMLWFDPQCADSHECAMCGREVYGDHTLCDVCRDRLEFDDDYE